MRAVHRTSELHVAAAPLKALKEQELSHGSVLVPFTCSEVAWRITLREGPDGDRVFGNSDGTASLFAAWRIIAGEVSVGQGIGVVLGPSSDATQPRCLCKQHHALVLFDIPGWSQWSWLCVGTDVVLLVLVDLGPRPGQPMPATVQHHALLRAGQPRHKPPASRQALLCGLGCVRVVVAVVEVVFVTDASVAQPRR
mmetsp:Transcript_36693/g.72622  ORF Transcript_36693/g.72622 Transcript_36693/m.72622 type:complete len:196 (-) Transcript_36693:673-1260(-)